MEGALTPRLALAYLRELSADVLAGIVLDAAGRRIAGRAELAEPARALLGAGAAVPGVVRTGGGSVFVARSATTAIVVATGPRVLTDLMRHDVEEILALLATAAPGTDAAASVVGTHPPAYAQPAPPDALRALAAAFVRAAAGVDSLPGEDR